MSHHSRFCFLLLIAALSLSTCIRCAAQPRGRRPSAATERATVRQVNAAVDALLIGSDLNAGRLAASAFVNASPVAPKRAITAQAARLDALFVDMEAAALQADTASVLDRAMSLIEASPSADARSEIAGARILDLAANTAEFRVIVPRIQRAIRRGSTQSAYLRSSLIAAGADGLPGISVLESARASGLITNWRVVGPFGRYANLAFDSSWPTERDGVVQSAYDGRRTEALEFQSGTFELPDYFPTTGVFYAASTVAIPATGSWMLRIESPGTLAVLVDGNMALAKDDRFRAAPELVSKALRLTAGEHRVVVKFIASAAPFRIAVLSATAPSRQTRLSSAAGLAQYLSASTAYWSGDYGSAIEQLTEMRKVHESAAVDYLLAQAWSRAEGSSSERTGLLQSALSIAPIALAADFELALKAYSEEHFDEALMRARRVLASRPQYEPAVRVLAKAASALDWQAEAARAYTKAVALHPTCEVLKEASEFFSSISDFSSAARSESEMQKCAPGSLTWAEALSKAGRHAEAAEAAEAVTRNFPLDRAAHTFFARELSKAGKFREAEAAAKRLVEMAPNSGEFHRMADAFDRGLGWDEAQPEIAADFATSRPFYAPYRRDGMVVTKQTAERKFSGGPAVLLLTDRVTQVRPDGSTSVYVHKITRVLDRDGILTYGEVSVPQGASLLELRTIKADGSVAEPEFNQHKATISMPALSPGDAIDLEYVVRYDDVTQSTDAFRFAFGSFAAPILFSRFVVLTPADARVQFAPFGDIPSVRVEERAGVVARVWEGTNIAQWTSEVATPPTGILPEIRVYPNADSWTGVRDFYRDALIGALRIGNRANAVAGAISGSTDEAKLRAVYKLVTSRVHSIRLDYASGDFASAESTLSSYTGSRTVAMLALARALGIEGDVLMTRDAGSSVPQVASMDAYSRPVIVFHCKDGDGRHDVLIDAESDGLGFGGIAARIERKDALFVLLSEAEAQSRQLISSLPTPSLDERSIAEADVSFDEGGNLNANVTIRMGAARSAQMRSILRGIEPDGRKHFFEQLAMRIFPGASEATGEVRNETDPDEALEIVLHCRAQHFINFEAQAADMDQLVPALGLKKMYVRFGGRRTPLYIDTPLFESAVFHVSLPGSMRFAALAGNMAESNEFGSYAVSFRQQAANRVDIQREFRIPVQVIQPDRFPGFSYFASRVDEAERQRLLVERNISDEQAGR